jgi:hypothetical protein
MLLVDMIKYREELGVDVSDIKRLHDQVINTNIAPNAEDLKIAISLMKSQAESVSGKLN